MKMHAKQVTVFDTDIQQGEYHSCSDECNSRPNSPSSSSWGFLKKLFKENKSVVANLTDNPAPTPNLPRKFRRASVGDHGMLTKSPSTMSRKDSACNKTHSKQRKSSFGAVRRKFSTAQSNENLLHFAVAEKDISTLQKLFDNTFTNVNHLRPPGISPLHLACVAGHLSVITLLTDNGADLKLKTWSGLTALQIANMFGHFEVAEYLISKGADSRDVQNGIADVRLMLIDQ